MRLTTEIGDQRRFVLKTAILVYNEIAHNRENFVTVHEVLQEGSEPQQPRLGPGALLTTTFLKALSAGLERPAKALLLPENVLVYTSELLIWWTPPRLHSMYFSDGAEDRAAVHGQVCPHPPLLWKVHRGHLFLRALSDSLRPKADTQLMVAPYWNTQALSGSVCAGSMPCPQETDLSSMLAWEEAFFNLTYAQISALSASKAALGAGLFCSYVSIILIPLPQPQ